MSRSLRRFLPLGVLVAVAVPPPGPTSPAQAIAYRRSSLEARRLLEAKQPAQAIALLEKLVETAPSDGMLWRLLGEARAETKQYRDAIAAYLRAVELGSLNLAEGEYRIAVCHALSGERRAALDSLRKALAHRYRRRPSIASDPRLASLRDDPEFRSLAGSTEAPTARTAGWRSDVDRLLSEIRRVHYRYSREPLPPEILREVSEVRSAIPRLADAEIVVRLQSLVSRLGDSHSLVFPFGMKRGALRRLPITLYLFSDGLFVVQAPEDLRGLVGLKVDSLGGLSSAAALERLKRFVSRDNPMGIAWTGPAYLTFPDFLKGMGAEVEPSAVRLVLTSADGSGRREVIVRAPEEPVDPDRIAVQLPPPGGVATPAPISLVRPEENFWFDDLGGDRTVYFQFNRCLDAKGESLADFALRLRRHLDERETRNLVVDVRRNNGGEARLLTELERTIVHFETAGRDRRLLVLIGRGTFSAAQQFVGALEVLAHPVFVGEPTGSRTKRPGDEAPFVLPFSGVRGALASGFHQVDSKDDRIWIAPHVPIALSSADYFANRDPVLDAALELISSEN